MAQPQPQLPLPGRPSARDVRAAARTSAVRRDRVELYELPVSKRVIFRRKKWLERSRYWDRPFRDLWQAERVLGSGTFGVCGLFSRRAAAPAGPAETPTNIVVKQAGGAGWDGQYAKIQLRKESRFLNVLNGAGSEHIVKLYTTYWEQQGTGTSIDFDNDAFPNGIYDNDLEVARIYLEFCELGDMASWAKSTYPDPNGNVGRRTMPPESTVWEIWECLVRALSICHRGTEDATTPAWQSPVIHFDVKPDNILRKAAHPGHPSTIVHKLADFGISENIPIRPDSNTGNRWINFAFDLGTPAYMSPEQVVSAGAPYFDRNHPHHTRRITTPTDIYSLGATMLWLLQQWGPNYTKPAGSKVRCLIQFTEDGLGGAAAAGPTAVRSMANGRPLEKRVWIFGGEELGQNKIPDWQGNDIQNPLYRYSRTLRKTIARCLAFYPDQRLTCQELLGIVQAARVVCTANAGLDKRSANWQDIDDVLDPRGRFRVRGDLDVVPAPEGNAPYSNYDLHGGFAPGVGHARYDIAGVNPWRTRAGPGNGSPNNVKWGDWRALPPRDNLRKKE